MPASEVILVAVFEKDEQSGSENTNVGDLFDEDDDDDLGLGDLFDEGTGGAHRHRHSLPESDSSILRTTRKNPLQENWKVPFFQTM